MQVVDRDEQLATSLLGCLSALFTARPPAQQEGGAAQQTVDAASVQVSAGLSLPCLPACLLETFVPLKAEIG